jgi:hypothetical protein
MERDAALASAELMAEFRTDIEAFLPREIVEADRRSPGQAPDAIGLVLLTINYVVTLNPQIVRFCLTVGGGLTKENSEYFTKSYK